MRHVALLGDDTHGLRARLAVEENSLVRRGQLLYEDRRSAGVRYTAPGAGRVLAIHRGERRALQSIVIELSEGERAGQPAPEELEQFDSWRPGVAAEARSAEEVRALLIETGLWTAIRTRPFSKIPPVDAEPGAVFVNGMDTRPLAADPDVVCAGRRDDLDLGLRLVAKLTAGPTYFCVAADSRLAEELTAPVRVERFQGPHPAGTPGLHVHTLAPVGRNSTVWTLDVQDVLAIGRLFATGVLPIDRVVSFAGPPVERPRLLQTRIGASLEELCQGELPGGELRVISGSVIDGKRAMGDVHGFLGRLDKQVSVLMEDRARPFLGWLAPGGDRFSILPTFLSRFTGRKRFAMTTTTNGSVRNMVPIGMYEQVMPMDILPTHLLRALVVGDLEEAEKLGALELDEEDLALCTFVCPGKTDYGPLLRINLQRIEEDA